MTNSDSKDQASNSGSAEIEELNNDDLDQVVGGNFPYPDTGSSSSAGGKKGKGSSSSGNEASGSKASTSSTNSSVTTPSVDVKVEGGNAERFLDLTTQKQD